MRISIVRASEIQENLAATLIMLNRFLDLERLICCRDWEAQSSRGHYLCCLGQRRTNLRKKLLVVHPEAPDIQPRTDEVAWWQIVRQSTQPRIASKTCYRRHPPFNPRPPS